MKHLHRYVVVAALLLTPLSAGAQPTSPATGPAQLIGRGNAAGEANRVERATSAADQATPEATAEEAPGEATPSSGGAPTESEQALRARARRALGSTEPASTAVDQALPAGTIHVTVLGADDRPAADVPVRIGIMAQGGAHDAVNGQTNAQGVFEATGLATGGDQAYRVTVPADGATYGATPFRLDLVHGQRVQIRRMATTHDDRAIIVVMGQSVLEMRDGRLHIVQQAQISNMGRDTYVFPEGGAQIALPSGFMAFEAQAVMTDQRITPNDDGFTIAGSIAAGSVTLAWAYDLPLDGRSMSFRVVLPFRAARYRVISSASPGLSLRATGFPAAQPTDAQGESFLITELARSPSDAPLTSFTVTLDGIPGPGPQRMIALGLAGVLVLLGFALFFKPGDRRRAEVAVLDARRQEILAEVTELGRAREASEVGPKYYDRRLGELRTELARLLQTQDRIAATGSPAKA